MTENPGEAVTQRAGKERWSAQDYLVFAFAGAFVLGIAVVAAVSSENPDFAILLLVAGGAVVVTWWLIGCTALGAQVAYRARDRER